MDDLENLKHRTLTYILHYIDNTPDSNDRYDITVNETLALMYATHAKASDELMNAIWLAFNYGQAKGYRAAMKQQKASRKG